MPALRTLNLVEQQQDLTQEYGHQKRVEPLMQAFM